MGAHSSKSTRSRASWRAALAEGQRLFNSGRFFAAHEILEDAWRVQTGKRKLCAQGLIQICAAFHKLQQAKKMTPGARYLIERGRAKIGDCEECPLLADMRTALEKLAVKRKP